MGWVVVLNEQRLIFGVNSAVLRYIRFRDKTRHDPRED